MVSDELWDRLEPLLPQRERGFRHPGRRALPGRGVLCGILYVLHTGIQWEYLPQDLGFGSGMACWSRLRDWNEGGVWQRFHEVLLAELNAAARLDWSRCVLYSSHVRALKGEPHGPLRWCPAKWCSQARAVNVWVSARGEHRSVADDLVQMTFLAEGSSVERPSALTWSPDARVERGQSVRE